MKVTYSLRKTTRRYYVNTFVLTYVIPASDTANMVRHIKKAQLQIRVTKAEKVAIHQAATRAGMDMSAYVLSRVLSIPAVRFQECVAGCASEASSRFALAELNSLLSELTPGETRDAVATPPSVALTPFLANYVAALVEYGCARCSLAPPAWTRSVMPLEEPAFGTSLQSLRLHLLTHSPAPFRLRNIFIDSSLGQRI
jgi:hypothetical protein